MPTAHNGPVTLEAPQPHLLDNESPADVLVIGGGILGLSTACEILFRGLSVTVFEEDVHRSAGWASAGMLSPYAERSLVPPSPAAETATSPVSGRGDDGATIRARDIRCKRAIFRTFYQPRTSPAVAGQSMRETFEPEAALAPTQPVISRQTGRC